MQFFKSEYLVDLSLALASKPVVALIDGACFHLQNKNHTFFCDFLQVSLWEEVSA